MHGRKTVSKKEILIGFNLYKYGHMDFSPSDVVLNVYNDAM